MSLNDPFLILGLPRRFDLDEAALRRAYLARVAAIHPDLTTEDAAQSASAELNQARELLGNPESRADVLLKLLGGPAKEADKSLPVGFLMDIMETREALDAALASKDASELERLNAWAHAQRQNYTEAVAAAFADANLKNVRTTLNAWRYIERMIEQMDPNTNALDL